MGMNTYATHPWVAKNLNGVYLELNDDEVFVPEADDNGKTIHINEEQRNCEITETSWKSSWSNGNWTKITNTTITNCCEGTIVHRKETQTNNGPPTMISNISQFDENPNCNFLP